jgi:hypothetical protein
MFLTTNEIIYRIALGSSNINTTSHFDLDPRYNRNFPDIIT